LKLEVTAAAKEKLLAEGWDPAYGARPMRRAIQRLIQDPLALRLLEGDFADGDTVKVDVGETGAMTFGKIPAPVEEPVLV
jgi:ATP-dependent Clp protease ATP-binding subunit ClpB